MRGAFGLLSLVVVLGVVAYLALQPAKTGLLKPASPEPGVSNARSQAEQQAKDAVNAALQQAAARASEAAQ